MRRPLRKIRPLPALRYYNDNNDDNEFAQFKFDTTRTPNLHAATHDYHYPGTDNLDNNNSRPDDLDNNDDGWADDDDQLDEHKLDQHQHDHHDFAPRTGNNNDNNDKHIDKHAPLALTVCPLANACRKHIHQRQRDQPFGGTRAKRLK